MFKFIPNAATPTVVTGQFYRPELDGLRFVAFMMVFLHHMPFPQVWVNQSDILRRIHEYGCAGVDIFLVLSSYLLTSLALREIHETGSFNISYFLKRRILRIWPLYFLALIIGFFIYPIITYLCFGDAFNFWNGIKYHLFPFAFFFGNFSYAAFTEYLGRYSSLWTINLEEQFYLFLPLMVSLLLIGIKPKRIIIVCLAGITVPILARAYFNWASIPYPWHWVSPVTRFDPFFLGFGAAVIDYKIKIKRVFYYLAFITAILVYMLISSSHSMQFSAHNIWQLSASGVFGVTLLFAARIAIFTKILSAKPISYLGKISFGLYVYHRYPLDLFTRLTDIFSINSYHPIAWISVFSLCLLIIFMISSLSYRYFEIFFLQKKRASEIVHSRPI